MPYSNDRRRLIRSAATRPAATLGILAIGGAALGNAIGGRGRALIGGVIGFIAATQVNEANDSVPTA